MLFFKLPRLMEKDLLHVLRKTRPISFTRLRRTCKWLDEFAEEHCSHIGIRLHQIDLAPLFNYVAVDPNNASGSCLGHRIKRGEVVFEADESIIFVVTQKKINKRGRITYPQLSCKLSDARKRLSGFGFEHIQFFGERDFFKSKTTWMAHMKPEVQSSYRNFIRNKRWYCRAIIFRPCQAHIEFIGATKPNLLFWTIASEILPPLPKNTETIQLCGIDLDSPFDIGDFLVKNLLLQAHWFSSEEMTVLVRNICTNWLEDTITVEYVHQHVELGELEGRLLYEFTAEGRGFDDQAAGKLLKKLLIETPHMDSEIVEFISEEADMRKSTANTRIYSKTGKTALLAVRFDQTPTDCDLILTFYFFANREDWLEADDYYEIPPDGFFFKTRGDRFEEMRQSLRSYHSSDSDFSDSD